MKPSEAAKALRVALIYLFYYHRNMEESDVIRALSALGQPQRLKIFRALVVGGKAGRTPGTLAESLAIPAATLSFHLKELVNAGLVTQERVSRNLVYRASYTRVDALLGYLTENCCEGQECLNPATAAWRC